MSLNNSIENNKSLGGGTAEIDESNSIAADAEDNVGKIDYVCSECKATECVMWRKLSSEIICNMCHIKRIQNATQNGTKSAAAQNKAKEVQAVRMSKRKNKTNKKFVNGYYNERIIKNGNSKNRRTLFKKKPVKSPGEVAKIMTSSATYCNGLLYQVGDIVCTCDVEGGTFYAQIRGFLQNEYCEKSVVVTWLIPKVANPSKFDPLLFVPALDEDHPRSMDCFDFVCRATTDLFKSRVLHTPYLRSQSNLSSLIQAATQIGDIESDGKEARDADVV